MGIISRGDLDILFKRRARDQLRTFNKTFSVRICAYMAGSWSGSCRYQGINFNDAGAPESVFNNDLSGNIQTGYPVRTQDIGDSVARAVRSAVDRIESVMGTRYLNAYYCHSSCHSSCHGSRGRR